MLLFTSTNGMQESYWWGGRVKRLSPAQIRKMKENMRKVPEIQKKSELYHRNEELAAEDILATQLDSTLEKKEINKSHLESPTEKRKTRWGKIKSALFW